jgi:hypothetical protein
MHNKGRRFVRALISPNPKKVALGVLIVPLSLMVTLDKSYNRNADVGIRGITVIPLIIL